MGEVLKKILALPRPPVAEYAMDVLSITFLAAAFMFFSAGLAVLLGIGQLCGRKRYFENYILSAYLFCLGVILFQVCMVVNDITIEHPGLLYFHVAALYFMAPIIYIADYLVILPVESMTRKMGLLFLPVLIGLSADIYFMAMPDPEKTALLRELFNGTRSPLSDAARIVIAGAGLQIIIYLGYLAVKLAMSRRKGASLFIFYVMVSSLFVVMTLAVITILGYALGSYTLLRWGANCTGLIIIVTYLLSQRFPKILQLLMFEEEKKYYGRSLLGQLDVGSVIEKLSRYMERERAYTDDQLSLRDLADEISITPHQLSQLLNERLNTNFNSYVNQFRVEDAKRMLRDDPTRTVLAIALDVGFNSKSAFYEAFTRFTGMSPQAYRKGREG